MHFNNFMIFLFYFNSILLFLFFLNFITEKKNLKPSFWFINIKHVKDSLDRRVLMNNGAFYFNLKYVTRFMYYNCLFF